MSNRECVRLQPVPFTSATTSTRVEFLQMMNSFLQRDSISLIGPSTTDIQQTEIAGMHTSRPILSLTREIRYTIQPVFIKGLQRIVVALR